MDFSEKWGTNVESAVELALNDLKLTREEVDVTVLEEPSRGFLGFGAKLAKVRVEKKKPEKVEKPAKPAKAAKSSKQENKQETKQAKRVEDLKVKEKPEKVVKSDESKVREKTEKSVKADDQKINEGIDRSDKADDRYAKSEDQKIKEKSERPERVEKAEEPKKVKSEKNSEAQKKNKTAKAEKFKAPEEPVIKKEAEEELRTVEVHPAIDFLKSVTTEMGLDLDIVVKEGKGSLYVDINGKDSGTIIGKRGQTLDAIQYLTSLVVNKEKENYTRVVVDAENYRSKREKTLEQLAVRLAAKVVKTKKSVRLEPMNPYERKVIHATLQNHPQVITRSEGQDPYRKVVIELKR